jgi:uncharacterized protein YndB with AHSA1/START domain
MSLQRDVAIQAVIKRRVSAPRERVFQAWTTAEHLQRWFFPGLDGDATPQAEVDLRVGGRYRITMHAADGHIAAMVGGVYHEVRPPEKLVFSWVWEAPDPEPSETLVTVELHEIQGETEVIITHEYSPDVITHGRHTIGWNCILERLTLLLESPALDPARVAPGDPCRT